ncbi:MAG: WD40 repeat domain-containing protein [Candidatus Aminicenantes bacterium]|nr:WD40 repeat domain-containing protein [Candidatus Aminicenantes bacterium]
MKRARFLLGSILILAAAAGAVVPQQWTLRSFDDFLRGKFSGIAVTSDGVLSLASPEEKIDGPSEDFYLSFVMTPEGTGYLGTGHGGKIYRLDKDGKADLYFQTAEMDVTCLLLGQKGILYAGTSPNGKIYEITASGKGQELFNPEERYIWDLALSESGNLLAAVGESGGIYEINPEGSGRLIFKADQTHILCLKIEPDGNIVAGSGGSGLVYRLAKNSGKGTVIFETPFEEVRSVAFDPDGNIYASAGGTVKASRGETVSAPIPVSAGNVDISISVSGEAAAPVQSSTGQGARPAAAAGSREPGAIYRIGPDGLARRIWFSPEEQVYSLFWNESERKIYFGTGPKGRLYMIDREEETSLLLQSEAEQAYACIPLGPRLYLLSNNPAGLSRISADRRLSGEYLGPVWDAKLASVWGRIDWEAALPAEGVLQFQSRSGNSAEPGSTWSEWSPPYQKAEGEQILSPKARYLQIRALFKSTSAKAGPALSRLSVHFLPANAAPSITRIELLGPNEVFLKPPDMDEAIWGLERRLPDAGRKTDDMRMIAAKKTERQGFRTLSWSGEDENGDTLVYSIALKRDGDKDWRTIEDHWPEEIFAFNTVYFPDGVYQMKVTASDALSNPAGREKTGEQTVGPLLIDNTAPAVKNLQVARAEGQLSVSFTAEDGFSAVKDARVLIRPGDWRVVFPEDGIADSKTESYKFRIPLPPGADGLVTIIVRDVVDNTATVRQVF